jgi:hypothetical protein
VHGHLDHVVEERVEAGPAEHPDLGRDRGWAHEAAAELPDDDVEDESLFLVSPFESDDEDDDDDSDFDSDAEDDDDGAVDDEDFDRLSFL